MADFAATGSDFLRPFQLGLLAEQLGRRGEVERGLAPSPMPSPWPSATSERWCEPELYRRRGELLEQASDWTAPRPRTREPSTSPATRARGHSNCVGDPAGRALAPQSGPPRPRRCCGPIVAGFAPSTDLPDLPRARRLLAAPSAAD